MAEARVLEASAPRLRVGYYVAYPDGLAGAGRSLFELIAHLPPDIEATVFLPREGQVSEFLRARAIQCEIIPAGAPLLSFGKAVVSWTPLKKAWVLGAECVPYSLALSRAFRRARIDLLHVNCARAAIMAAPAAKLMGIPVVGHSRGRRPLDRHYWRIFEFLCDRIITVCDAIQSDLSASGRAKATTVYNGTRDLSAERDKAVPDAARLRWLRQLRQQGTLVVSCFGSLTPFKGQHHLIEAAALLKEQGLSNVAFVCVGGEANESYAAWLRQRVARRGLDNITFAGWQDDPFPFYAQTDVSALPSVEREELEMDGLVVDVRGNEGFPRTHLEAMAMALPVVATRIAGVPEQVVDGTTGLVVPPGSPHELAAALGRLLGDAQLRARMGQAGHARVTQLFTAERCVDGTLAVYRSLLSSRLAFNSRTL